MQLSVNSFVIQLVLCVPLQALQTCLFCGIIGRFLDLQLVTQLSAKHLWRSQSYKRSKNPLSYVHNWKTRRLPFTSCANASLSVKGCSSHEPVHPSTRNGCLLRATKQSE